MNDVAGGLITLEYALEGLKYLPEPGAAEGALSARDADIVAYIQAATPIIEDHPEIGIGPVLQRQVTKRFNGGKVGIALSGRIAEDAIVSVTEDDIAVTDYTLDENARIIFAGTRQSARRFAPGRRNIAVTYTAGWPEGQIPQLVQLAARELVVFWVQQGKNNPTPNFNPAFDAGSGSGRTPMGFAIPNRVTELLAVYRSSAGMA